MVLAERGPVLQNHTENVSPTCPPHVPYMSLARCPEEAKVSSLEGCLQAGFLAPVLCRVMAPLSRGVPQKVPDLEASSALL